MMASRAALSRASLNASLAFRALRSRASSESAGSMSRSGRLWVDSKATSFGELLMRLWFGLDGSSSELESPRLCQLTPYCNHFKGGVGFGCRVAQTAGLLYRRPLVCQGPVGI